MIYNITKIFVALWHHILTEIRFVSFGRVLIVSLYICIVFVYMPFTRSKCFIPSRAALIGGPTGI